LIANEKPEILCIQDYYNGNGRSTNLADSIKKYGHFAYQDVQLINKPDHGLPYGLAIFSKYPVISQQKVDFPDTRANFCHSVDIIYQKDTVRICNLHFESIKFGKADYDFVSQMTNTPAANEKTKRSLRTIVGKMRSAYKKRAVQAKIVAQYIQSSPYPIILAGDFNDTPVSYTYRQIDEKLDDSFAEIGFGIGQSHYQMLPILRIDYIFHSKQFKPISYQTIRKDFSDHFPIVARFVPNK
jgi:endonuclease/exonuclease/phosphatase family metal-dependent hydrolase